MKPQFTDIEKFTAKAMLKSHGKPRDTLPYTQEFDDMHEEFQDETLVNISKNDFWRLLCTVAKQGGCATSRKKQSNGDQR